MIDPIKSVIVFERSSDSVEEIRDRKITTIDAAEHYVDVQSTLLAYDTLLDRISVMDWTEAHNELRSFLRRVRKATSLIGVYGDGI